MYLAWIIGFSSTFHHATASPLFSEAAPSIESTVGWVDSPSKRGTSQLVLGCLVTTLASTWAVLHLNIPSLKDRWHDKLVRKAKWMVLTVLFPEFILAKAICDLRHAISDQFEMHKMLQDPPDTLRIKGERIATYLDGSPGKFLCRWSWEAPFDRVHRFLYWILGARFVKVNDSHSSAQEPASSQPAAESAPLGPDIGEAAGSRQHDHEEIQRQIWTMAHTCYLNMGGLRAKPGHISRHNAERDVVVTMAYILKPDSRLLEHITLTSADIEDKSKADWLLKSFTVLQIGWLLVEVLVRKLSKLPISQLEVATFSFAITAIVTYAANWWKPKDINIPTVMFKQIGTQGLELGSFSLRMLVWTNLNLTRCAPSYNIPDRIQNDLVPMSERAPVLSVILALSSLGFGGLHCLAWSLHFSTATEMAMWRISSLATALLPLLAIGSSIILERLYRSRQDRLKTLRDLATVIRHSLAFLSLTALISYITARVILIAICFSSLRSSPAGVYETTPWMQFLPRFS
ncbi:hypothetical protein QBC36DRAFT_179794 [Triangularia setosa]|uniref:Uncharacterized protein n=1 Tax=Triangularia setosa TaxID=2587417 RepID=A0AAN6WD44_9PEZI|nr:hypothetical protein QBC36DRAFT_179794 [Podospora setosa]